MAGRLMGDQRMFYRDPNRTQVVRSVLDPVAPNVSRHTSHGAQNYYSWAADTSAQ